MLNGGVHDGPRFRGGLSIGLPGVLDGLAAHPVVLVVGVRAPPASLEDVADGAVGVELGEELVNEARGGLEAFAVAVNPVPAASLGLFVSVVAAPPGAPAVIEVHAERDGRDLEEHAQRRREVVFVILACDRTLGT